MAEQINSKRSSNGARRANGEGSIYPVKGTKKWQVAVYQMNTKSEWKRVRMNFSKTGVGFSFGPRHAKISISPRGRITSNIGIPDTGIRYTQVSTPNSRRRQAEAAAQQEYVAPPPRSPLHTFMRGLTWSSFALLSLCFFNNWITASNVFIGIWWASIFLRIILWSLSSYLQGRPRPGGPAEADEITS